MTSFDVIIVGSGPAGGSAALELAESGWEVLVLDRASMPRHKPCGGAAPSSIKKILKIDLSDIIENRTRVISIFHNYKDEITIEAPGDAAPLLINRSAFDSFLIAHAVKKSRGRITFREKCHVAFGCETEECISIVVNGGEKIHAKFLIAADGAHSKFASAVHLLPARTFAKALDAEMITDAVYYENHAHRMVMNLFCLPQGYGWIFPKGPCRFSCGVGSWGKAKNLSQSLKNFLSKSVPGDAVKNIAISGHLLPLYQGAEKIATRRVFLAGDAAALVDPVSGEGIRHALLSGKLAASAIARQLNDGGDRDLFAADLYQESVDERIGKELTNKLKFAYVAFHASPDFFYKTFVKRNKNIPHFNRDVI